MRSLTSVNTNVFSCTCCSIVDDLATDDILMMMLIHVMLSPNSCLPVSFVSLLVICGLVGNTNFTLVAVT